MFMATMLLLPLLMRGQQPVVFDTVRFNEAGSFAVGYSAFETDSGYMVFSLQKSLDTASQDIFILRFGPEGGLIDERSFHTYRQDHMGTSSPLERINDGYCSGVARFGVGVAIDSLFLYRYGNVGDTLWTRFIDADSSFVHRGTFVSDNGDVLLAGTHDPGRQAYIYHLDSVGNIKGFHEYPGFNGEDVVEGADGSWYVCGLGNQQSNYGRAILLRSDTTGEEQWRYTDWSMYGRFVSMIALRDSSVIGLGSRNPLDSNQRATLTKLDHTGSLSWIRDPWRTDHGSWICRFHAGYEKEDGTLCVAGTVRDTLSRDAGMLFKLDADGNTIWHRFYSHYPGASYGKDQIFWDVKPTSDGGMVLTGETNSDDYAYAQLWLLKLDSMGCLVPGCGSVGVEEYTDALQPLLRVSPNPASEVVSVFLELPHGAEVQGQVQAQLLDASGGLVAQQTVQHVTSSAAGTLNQLRTTVDVSALPAGLYYLHLRDAKRWLAGSKLVVE